MIGFDLKDLPDGWTLAEISHLGDVVTGSTPPTKNPDFFNGDIPFFKPTDLDAGYDVAEARQYLSQLGADKSRLLPENSVLVTCIGATIGKIGLARRICTTNQQINAVVVNKYISPHWLYWILCSPECQRLIIDNSSATTLPILNKSRFSELTLPLPPLNEQRRIVSTIEQLTDRSHKARAALEDVPKLIAQFRQSVLAAAFRGDLTADWREENPNFNVYESFAHAHKDVKGWVTLKAEDVCNVQSGSTPKGKPFTEVGDIPYLKVYNIVDQRINFNYRPQFIPIEVHRKELKRCVTLPGDVLMNIVGPPLGKIAIVTDQFQEWNINQALVLFRPNTGLSNRYLYYFLREGKFIREIDNETKGSVGQVNISLTQCRQCLIPIPSKEEQEEIVRCIELMFQQIDRIYQQYEQAKAWLDTLDRSILAKAFRGELVPQDPNDEPAAVLLERIRAERDRTSTPKQRGKTARKHSSKQLSIAYGRPEVNDGIE